MKILPIIIPCCLILSCEPAQKDTQPPKKETIIVPAVKETAAKNTKTPSFLDVPVEEKKSNHEAKYTFHAPEDNSVITFGGYTSPRPSSWEWVIPKTISVTCSYVLPSSTDADQALITITQVLNADTETINKSIDRWKTLFRSDEGGPVYASKKILSIDGQDATQVTIHGEFMGAGSGWRLHDHLIQVIVVKNDIMTTFIKILGARETIAAHENDIQNFLQNITWVEQLLD